MKDILCTAVGVLGSWIASLFGGWDAAMGTLIVFMAVDWITGLIAAGVFHNSPKSTGGALESGAGWKGLCKKGVTLLEFRRVLFRSGHTAGGAGGVPVGPGDRVKFHS